MDLYSVFHESVLKHSDNTVIRFEGENCCFTELGNQASAIAEWLKQRFPDEGKIALFAANDPGFVPGFFGILGAGKTAVPLNYLFQPPEIVHILEHGGVGTVLYSEALDKRVSELKAVTGAESLVFIPIEEIIRNAPPALSDPPSPPDIAVLMYTSGTTGRPKGVMLTQDNLISNALACIEVFGFTSSHEFIAVLPLFHAFGLTALMLVAVISGAKLRLLPRFHPQLVLKEFLEANRGIFFGVPAMFNLLARSNVSETGFPGMELCVSGSAPLPIPVKKAFDAKFGFPVCEGYGLSETSPVVASNLPHYDRPGSVGKVVLGVDVEIREGGRALPVGEIGEIAVHGRNVMAGYYCDEQATREILSEDGWLLTGDMGRLDEDGYLYIVGRFKDMFITGGEKIYPREVEEFLLTLPDVAEAALVPVPHPLKGEIGVCYVVPEAGKTLDLEDLKRLCAEGLARYKVPSAFEVLDALPRNTIGKIDKRKLREMAAG